MWHKNFIIRLTHIPTGITATVDNQYSRSEHRCREMCIKLLNARVWAATNNLDNAVLVSYDSSYYSKPNELTDFNRLMETENET